MRDLAQININRDSSGGVGCPCVVLELINLVERVDDFSDGGSVLAWAGISV